MTGRRLWLVAGLAGVAASGGLVFASGMATRAPLNGCANAPMPLKMMGFKLDGRNRQLLSNGRPIADNVEISRRDCATPSGPWRRAPARVSTQNRSCGRIVDRLGHAVQIGNMCRMVPVAAPTRIARWAEYPGGLGSCAVEGRAYHEYASGSFDITLRMQEVQEGPGCSAPGAHTPRDQRVTVDANRQTSLGCIRDNVYMCTVTTRIACKVNGSTSFCPAD
jgi:hypothetical protein